MARHRAPRYVAVLVTGIVSATTGLALLLTPSAPLAARSGSVVDGPPASPAAQVVPDGGAPSTAPVAPGVEVPVPVGFIPDRLVVEALDVDAR